MSSGPVRNYWELRYRKTRSKLDEWIVLIYTSEAAALNSYRTLDKRMDVIEKKIVCLQK